MAQTTETVATWAQTYLATRGIDPATAERFGVRLVLPDKIDGLTGRKDGHQIQAGIWFPYASGGRLRCYAPPVLLNGESYAPGVEVGDVRRAVYASDVRNVAISGEWKARYTSETTGWYVYPAADQLIHVSDDQQARRVDYYPTSIAPEARELADRAFVSIETAKFIAPKGQAVQLYRPAPVAGGRPLIVAEGETRVLAVLATGAAVDVVGISGVSQWHTKGSTDLLPELASAVAGATRVIVAFDADFATNAAVAHQLVKLAAAVRGAKEGIDVRVCVPQINRVKAGLDDLLAERSVAARLPWVDRMVDDALPADLWATVKQLRAERFDDVDLLRAGRPDNPADLLALARDLSLGACEMLRKAFADLEYPAPPHPDPAGKLFGLTDKGVRRRATLPEVAQAVPAYLTPSISFLPVLSPRGQAIVYRVTDGLVRPASADALKTSIADRLAVLLGDRPTSKEVTEAHAQFLLSAAHVEIVPVRRSGDKVLAYSELPAARSGNLDAWDEFLSRLSCRDTFLAWLHTLTLPEAASGRQALYLRGSGHDGKSTVIDVLCSALGAPYSDVAVTVSDIASRDKFAFAGVRPWTRLLFLDDVRNPSLLHYKAVRNLLAGATMAVEQKFKDAELMRLHPPILVASNIQLRFDLSNRAEATRVLQVDVAPRSGGGDADWPERLKEELPALLEAAAEAHARLADQTDIHLTPATKEAMQAGQDASEDRFDAILPRIKLVPEGRTAVSSLRAALESAGIVDDRGKYDVTEFFKWLSDRGCRKTTARIEGRPTKVWVGVLLLDQFSDEEFVPTKPSTCSFAVSA